MISKQKLIKVIIILYEKNIFYLGIKEKHKKWS